MEEKNLSEKEALELIARVFDQNMRRMNFVRGELFIFWGVLIALTAIAEYALLCWTGDVRVLWSWFVPLTCGYIYTVWNNKRLALVRTGFDDLLILIWSIPFMVSVLSITYAIITPENKVNPIGIMELMLGVAVVMTAQFFQGKGSNHSGSYALLLGFGIAGITGAFNILFKYPFDPASGGWMILVAFSSAILILIPGVILRHISKKQCSKS